MNRNVRQWLGDALESAELLTLHLGDITYEQFQLDAWLKGAVGRRLEIIGEALRRSRDADPELFTSTPRLHEWIALRNFISHQYDGINEFAIWNAATGEINELVLTLRSVLSPPQDD